MDPFDQLPMEMIQTILSFLYTDQIYTQETGEKCMVYMSYLDPKQAVQNCILSKRFQEPFSTIPDLFFTDVAFNNVLLDVSQDQQVEKSRERFIMYVDHTLTRYQQHNLPIRKLSLHTRVVDDKTANILEQCLRKAKEHRAKEVCLNISFFPSNSSASLLQSIFALRDHLHVLELFRCDSVNDIIQDNIFLKFSSLRILMLAEVSIDEGVLQRLIHSCHVIKEINIWNCEGPKTIQVAKIPTLKLFHVCTVNNQMVDVKAESLEIMIYQTHERDSQYLLSMESTQTLKELYLKNLNITDEQLHKLKSKFPSLKKLCLEECYEIRKINVSSHLLNFLSLALCEGLMEVKIDAPNLSQFEFTGSILHSLYFAAPEGCGRRKSCVLLGFDRLQNESPFLKLSEFLMKFKQSDNIELIIYPEGMSFDKNTIDDPRESVPEFEELFLTVGESSTTYSSLMDGLLWSFSPKILSVKCELKEDKDFIKYLCEELLLEHEPNISNSSSSESWRNYFTLAKFEGRDNEWRPLHSWKSLEDALQNLGDVYTMKLSHAEHEHV